MKKQHFLLLIDIHYCRHTNISPAQVYLILKLCSRTFWLSKIGPFPIPSCLACWVARPCDVSIGRKIQNKNARLNGMPLIKPISGQFWFWISASSCPQPELEQNHPLL
jgi:hypothetical protein